MARDPAVRLAVLSLVTNYVVLADYVDRHAHRFDQDQDTREDKLAGSQQSLGARRVPYCSVILQRFHAAFDRPCLSGNRGQWISSHGVPAATAQWIVGTTVCDRSALRRSTRRSASVMGGVVGSMGSHTWSGSSGYWRWR